MKERIKKLRKSLKKTQKGMAEFIGVSLSTWQKYEWGTKKPSGEVLTAIRNLGFSIDWLITGEGEMCPNITEPTTTGPGPTSSIDTNLLSLCTDAVDNLYKEMGIYLRLAEIVRLGAETYADVTAAGATPEEQETTLKALINQQKRNIQKEQNANKSGKRLA